MKKATPQPQVISIDNEWHSNLIDWISTNKKFVLCSFSALLIFLLFATGFFSFRNSNAENDFFLAQKIFTEFQQKNIASDSSELDQLNAIMQRHPEVKPRFEGSLAQSLILTGQAAKAQIFANDIFYRTTPNHLKLYQDYSETSLLITEEKYEEAIARALQLQMLLEQSDEKIQPLLYTYNLIRLALLYQLIGQPEKELATWETFQNKTRNLEAFTSVNNILKVGQATLSEFIEERKRILKS